MQSGLAKTFSLNTCQKQLFLSSLASDAWPVSYSILPRPTATLFNYTALPAYLPRKAGTSFHSPPCKRSIFLFSFFPVSCLKEIAQIDFSDSIFACVMEHCFTNFFWPQSTVGIKFYIVNQNIHPYAHKHTLQRDSTKTFSKRYCVSFLGLL